MPTVELRFAALNGHVRTARMIATAVSRRAGVPVSAADEIKLAVTEACTRAVRVNRRHAPQAPVHVALTDGADSFTITVADCGRTGDEVAPGPDGGLVTATTLLELGSESTQPPGWAEPADDDPSADNSGFPPGLGLALIEGLVDEIEIRRGPDGVGTVVAMTWHTGATSDPCESAV
ncbi:anti-sigma factor [Frankia sp. CcI156]|jgi:anti-sigma regulatory factor (Ser/Thr protein kinase)|uniref:Serine/threonine kinase anti-sigma factor n=2 Tax=Frankia casuarinae (strain DSM 45818 / CECT 9043 / HFP020203 / CcI3) TaxID=106370 RepID=Q2J4Z3_FRACC|nr:MULTISPECIES: ATP-binding protein [Frankia]ABD13649.1 putative serine/threonine kinase anti-sigma factor [Frankia casuarinae]ETA02603.1 anti-sigma regulatory factor (Ser/Thr protein kinase) [Frankia sp. CcI6]EYT92799.1 anti-sigma regulatory factor (Ser/Thr protein kinase) [Frankia casuarinae]KDA43243.1 anti-sigma regulatory factor (Ser/Thr protein kinase) [Frankia sp. BMG5.23]KEZ37962.1 anti-sigma regulatory factor (Ser/Thr protein kinase) [Frankia sp. CeD]